MLSAVISKGILKKFKYSYKKKIVLKPHFDKFCTEIEIPGVRECYSANHFVVRYLWIIFLTVGSALTAYFIYADVSDYTENPTATKVYASRSVNYSLPPIYFGATQMDNHILGWQMMGLSDMAIQYIQSLNLQFRNGSGESLYSESRNEFRHFVKSKNITMWADLFQSTSLDMFNDFLLVCPECKWEAEFEPAKFVSFLGPHFLAILYEVPFEVATPSWVRTSDTDLGMQFSFVKNSIHSYYIALGKPYHLVTADDFLPIWPNFDYDIRINAYRIISQNNGKCENSDVSSKNSYHPKLCADKCSDSHLKECGKCKKMRPEDPIELSNNSYINEYCSTMKHDVNCIHTKNIEDPIIKCTMECLPLCDQTVYEYGIVNVPSFDNRIKITFYPTYTDAGILTFEEIPTYTFESAVSNIGGQLGLWLGLSIVTLVQVVLFWLNQCLTKDNTDKQDYDKPPTYAVSTLQTLV